MKVLEQITEIATADEQSMSPLQQFVEHPLFKGIIFGLIALSALLLGIETSADLSSAVIEWLLHINQIILWVFVIELVLRIAAHKTAFFRDPWNLFDFTIVTVSFIPPPGAVQVLRALRVLRAMRLVSSVSSLRRVVDGLLSAVPGILSVVALLMLVLYIASVMATFLFRDVAPDDFGHLWLSLFTLFQIMTLDGWPDIAKPIMELQPWAWLFFVTYILLATFLVLNLFIGIVVSAIQSRIEEEAAESGPQAQMARDLAELRREVSALREALKRER